MKKSGVSVKKPNLLDPSRIKVDLKKIFLKLAEAATRASIANPPGVDPSAQFAVAAVGAIDGISLNAPVSERAWYLIKKSIAVSVHQLVDEWVANHRPYAGDVKNLDDKLDLMLESESITIDAEFYKNPTRLELIPKVSSYLASWFSRIGLDDAEARAMAARFESYFVSALHNEWRLNREYYLPLLNKTESPFQEANQLGDDWQRYKAKIRRVVDNPVFGEVFSLRQIYVPLRVSYQRRTENKDGEFETENVVVDGAQDIRAWIDASGNRDTISVIRGGPGSGKSSLLRMLASDLVEEGTHRVLFFPLQRFSLSDQLITSIGNYLTITESFSRNPLEQSTFIPSSGLLVLMFDGLDELTKPGELAEVEAKRFLGELRTTLAALNFERTRVLALVSGRTALVQASRDALRLQSRRELDILKFFLPPIERFRYADTNKLLNVDHRLEWWRKYAELKNEPAEIPKSLLRKDIEELSAEPLLIYLLVASGFHRQDIPADFNRNFIYEKLLFGVLDRPYEEKHNEARMSHGEFAEVLEAIATAAWYGDGRTATVDEIRSKCPEKIKALLEKLISGMGGMHKLIASFYFQESERGRSAGKESFEFTHKSFGEYLTARRIVRQIDSISKVLRLEEEYYTVAQAAKAWFELCSPAAFNSELLRFVHDELRSPKWNNAVKDWTGQLGKLFQFYLDKGVISEIAAAYSYRIAESNMRNSEEALLVVMSSCAASAGLIISPKWASVHAAGNMLHRIIQQRYAGSPAIALNISSINFDGQNFMNQGMTHTVADRSSFAGTRFFGSDLRTSSFTNCNFMGADLRACTVDRVSFVGSDFEGAKLDQIRQNQAPYSLRRSKTSSSSQLENSRLRVPSKSVSRDVNAVQGSSGSSILRFRRTKLVGVSFLQANLMGADFQEANLSGADFRGAFLHNADLSSATLEGCNFTDSRMTPNDAALLQARGVNIDRVDTSTSPSVIFKYDRSYRENLSVLYDEDIAIK